MLNVTYKPFVLSVIILSVVRQNVVMLSVVAPFHISYENSTIFCETFLWEIYTNKFFYIADPVTY
jgi:hypothetical protein